MPVSRLIDEYFRPAKVRRSGSQTGQLGKVYSNPPFSFREQDFLSKFKYLYIIGREYEIPREDRQKTIGTSNVQTYKRQAEELINLQSWNDLIRFEKAHPGTLALVPGPCQICARTHEGCGRPKNEPCHHLDLMRFSMEGIGIDADALAKFELGLLLRWPDDGHLPQKLSAVMGILSNEKIPMDEVKSFFPDAEKNFLNFKEKEVLDPNILSPEIKRQSSWLDNQKRQRREVEDREGKRTAWLGFKDNSLDSGAYVANQSWKTAEDEAELPSEHLANAPKPETELPAEHIGKQLSESGLPSEHIKVKSREPVVDEEPERRHVEAAPAAAAAAEPVPEDSAAEAPADSEEDDSKYKWLGFKRSLAEANENFYNRPIPKFNVKDEEAAEEEADAEVVFDDDLGPEEGPQDQGLPKWKSNPALALQPGEEGYEESVGAASEQAAPETPFDDDVNPSEFSGDSGLPKWKSNPALAPEPDNPAEKVPAYAAESIVESERKMSALQEPGMDSSAAVKPASKHADEAPEPEDTKTGEFERFIRSMDVETLRKIIEVKLGDNGTKTTSQPDDEAMKARRREEQKAQLQSALTAKFEERQRMKAEREREEAARLQAQSDLAAAEERRQQEAKDAEREKIRAEIEARLLEKQAAQQKQAEEAAQRAREEEEAKRKAEDEKRMAEEERRRIEEAKLPDASTVENVLGAALSIAQAVSGGQTADQADKPAAVQKPKKAPVRHSYKWLNYKSELKEDDDSVTDWKKR